MGVTEAAIAASVIGTAVGAGTSIAEAQRRNKALSNQEEAERRAERVKREQLESQTIQQRQQRERRGVRNRGLLLAAGAEAGVGLGGSFGQAVDVSLASEEEDILTLIENLRRGSTFVSSQTSSRVAALGSNRAATGLAGLQGGIQGARSGLAFVGGLQGTGLLAEPEA